MYRRTNDPLSRLEGEIARRRQLRRRNRQLMERLLVAKARARAIREESRRTLAWSRDLRESRHVRVRAT
jgi:hypothetical protein